MNPAQQSFAQMLKEAEDFDGLGPNGYGLRANVVWWDCLIVPFLQRRRRQALAGKVVVQRPVHDEMRHRDLMAKAQAAAHARPAIVVLRGPQSGSQRPVIAPSKEELRTAARRRARLALS